MPTTNYIWDVVSDNLLMEKDDDDNTIASYEHEPGPFGELISQRRNEQTNYYDYDGEGNTRAVTDQNGNVVETATYSAFGEVVAKTSSIVNPFGYKGALGYYTNSVTNDLDVRARIYKPIITRWLSIDPNGFAVAGAGIGNSQAHAYRYVGNNPTNYVDPSGLVASCTRGVCDLTRGSFDAIQFNDESENSWVGSNMYLSWMPNRTTFTNASGCCCCDSVGFVQTGRYTLTYTDRSENSTKWFLDGGVPYRANRWDTPITQNPCKPNHVGISMADAPRAKKWAGYWLFAIPYKQLARAEMSFETCVVCLSGVEGIRYQVDIAGSMSVVDSSVTAYGCVTWGHTIVLNPKSQKYEYRRTVNGADKSGQNAAFDIQAVGSCPSRNWREAVAFSTLVYQAPVPP